MDCLDAYPTHRSGGGGGGGARGVVVPEGSVWSGMSDWQSQAGRVWDTLLRISTFDACRGEDMARRKEKGPTQADKSLPGVPSTYPPCKPMDSFREGKRRINWMNLSLFGNHGFIAVFNVFQKRGV